MTIPAFLDGLGRDLRYAVRILRKNPGFTLTAVLTLALTIGANTAVFSIVDALLIRPLPYPDPERLAVISTKYEVPSRGINSDQQSQDGRTWEMVRDHAQTIDAAVYSDFDLTGGVNLVTAAGPMYVKQQRVGSGFFAVLGVRPFMGREFTRAEDVPNGPALAILSHRLWQNAFEGDPGVIGKAITLKGEPFTVVGVMPAGFQSSVPADIWTPIRPSTTGEGGGTNYGILARVRDGVSWEHANAEIGSIGAERMKERPVGTDRRVTFRLMPLQQGRTADVRPQLIVLWGAVIVVLVIACINIAGLLLARGGARAREIATRLALGGGRAVVVRQLLVESLVLGIAGGALGIALGQAALGALSDVAREVFGVWQPLEIDGRVLAVTTALTVGCALLFGLAPAWQASRLHVQPTLVHGGTRGATRASGWPRRVLIVAEVALGVTLLVCAGLLVRTFVNLRSLQPGFDANGVVAATVSLDDARYRDGEAVTRLFESTLARIRQAPGVTSAAVSLGAPYTRLLNLGFKRLDGGGPETRRGTITNLSYVSPEFFSTLRVPMMGGRDFSVRDTAESEGVAIVNQEFARLYFTGEDPIGHRIGTAGRERTIVGVVGNVLSRDPGWGNYGPIAATAMVYIPASQTSPAFLRLIHTWFSPVFVVRSARGVQGLEPVVRSALAAVDPQLPVARFESLAEIQALSMAGQRFMAMLLVVLGGIAALLAAIGIHGLIASTVTERTRELGIRVALGATLAQAIRSVALTGILLAAAGTILGSVLAVSAEKFIGSQLWGVAPRDPLAFSASAAFLLTVAAIASFIPALRLLRLDPAITLRAE
jgi:predicted permease